MDVIIYDDELKAFGNSISDFGKKLEDIYDQYLNSMEKLSNEGIISGDVADDLRSVATNASKLKGYIAYLSKYVKTFNQNYIYNIDKADQFLY